MIVLIGFFLEASFGLSGGMSSASELLDAQNWELVSDDGGTRVFRKEVPGTELFAFRGETIIDAPLAVIAGILMDTSRKTEWVSRIAQARDIEIISDRERIEYNHTHSGFFLVRDRDFVFRAVGSFDRATRTFNVELKSIADHRVPETDNVRGEIQRGLYVLREIDSSKTDVSVEILLDPKGSVPKWLVNLIQKSWPKRTLDGIRMQSKKHDLKRYPAAMSALGKTKGANP